MRYQVNVWEDYFLRKRGRDGVGHWVKQYQWETHLGDQYESDEEDFDDMDFLNHYLTPSFRGLE